MDQDKSLSCICVHWKTKKPYFGGYRRTPYFQLRQDELCLEIALEDTYKTNLVTTLVWRRPTSSITVLFTKCYLTVGEVILQNQRRIDKSDDYGPVLVNKILTEYGTEVDEILSTENVEEWIVVCQLSCDIPFLSQNEKKTIYLSTVDDTISPARSVDRCVQVSSVIPRDIEALSCDFSRMLKEEILPDFKLECGGRTFQVHRSVLATRSEVFRAMFRNKMQESETGSVVIQDLQVPILDLLLKFVYSGKLENITVDTAADLYEAADKYSLRSLMTACSHYMIRNVTIKNCLSYLKIADLHYDPDLKAAVALFIFKHPSVFKSTDWKSFSVERPLLAKEVLQDYVSSINP